MTRPLFDLFCVCCICGTCVSCHRESIDFSFADFKIAELVPQNTDIVLDSITMQPARMRYHPSGFLVFSTQGQEHLLSIADLQNGQVSQIVPRGRGPGELLEIWEMYVSGDDLVLYSLLEKKILRLCLSDDRTFSLKQEIQLDEMYGMVAPLQEGYAATCLSEDLFSVLDESGKPIRTFPFPDYLKKGDNKGNNRIYQCNLECDPVTGIIYILRKTLPFIEIYDSFGSLHSVRQGPEVLAWELFQNDMGGGAFSFEQRPFVMTYDRCRILPDHSMMVQYRPISDQKSCKLLWFDADGRPKAMYELPEGSGLFDIDFKHHLLYLIITSSDGIPGLKVYTF